MGCCESHQEDRRALLAPNQPNINGPHPPFSTPFVPLKPSKPQVNPNPSLNSVIQNVQRLQETQPTNSLPNSFSLGPSLGLDSFDLQQQEKLEVIVAIASKNFIDIADETGPPSLDYLSDRYDYYKSTLNQGMMGRSPSSILCNARQNMDFHSEAVVRFCFATESEKKLQNLIDMGVETLSNMKVTEVGPLFIGFEDVNTN